MQLTQWDKEENSEKSGKSNEVRVKSNNMYRKVSEVITLQDGGKRVS